MIQKQFVHDPVDLPHNWQEVTVQLFIEQFPKPAGAESGGSYVGVLVRP
jgi:hypothetical protein